GEVFDLTFGNWRSRRGAWDNRVVNGVYVNTIQEMIPGFVRRDSVAFVATHLHSKSAAADLAYEHGYLFKQRISLAKPKPEIILPMNPLIRLFAITVVADGNSETCAATVLVD